MKLSRSRFYYRPSQTDARLRTDLALREKIEQIHLVHPGYGYRRIYHHLKREKNIVNSKRIRRIMKQYELFSCLKKWLRPKGARIGKRLTHPNLIRGLKVNAPNQVWVTDITYISLLREFIYLSAIMDVYTRKIVGWAISRSLGHEFCLEALKIAIRTQKPPKGVIHHSDRGVQYVCEPYVDYLTEHGFQISMSALATPEDNAFIESFFKTLKKEEIYVRQYETMSDVLRQLPKFIDEVYNQKRLHSSLGYKPPEEFEREIAKKKPARRPALKIWGKAA